LKFLSSLPLIKKNIPDGWKALCPGISEPEVLEGLASDWAADTADAVMHERQVSYREEGHARFFAV
jgi:hypothetical protein